MAFLRDVLIVLAFAFSAPTASADASVSNIQMSCDGALQQGGVIICKAPPGTELTLGDTRLTAADDGLAIFGLPRDAPDSVDIAVSEAVRASETLSLYIAPRSDPFRVVKGLDCDKVDARTPEQKAHAGDSWVKKQDAFATFHNGIGTAAGFIRPSEGRSSSPFGPERRYIGVSAVTGEPCDRVSVHRGYDIAAPIGTPIIAPAPGTVILADPDLYFEGGSVFLDHGHGLVSVFIHMSEIDVEVGDEISQGERIGAVGNTGRTAGPHLHWAVKWRDLSTDDRSGDFYIDPALLFDLPQP